MRPLVPVIHLAGFKADLKPSLSGGGADGGAGAYFIFEILILEPLGYFLSDKSRKEWDRANEVLEY